MKNKVVGVDLNRGSLIILGPRAYLPMGNISCVRLFMPLFEKTSEIPVPVEALFNWYSRPQALVRLTPPFERARLVEKSGGFEEGGKVVLPNLEIYSFDGNGFILTACSQDGAARLLTGAKRPTNEQLSLHLKAVYGEISVRTIWREHQQRVIEWEGRGAKIRELTPTNLLPSLSYIYS